VDTATLFISKSMQLEGFVYLARLGSARLEHFRRRLGSARIFVILTRIELSGRWFGLARPMIPQGRRLGSDLKTHSLLRAELRLTFWLGSSLSLMQGRQFGSVPVLRWLCAVGSWVSSFVSVSLVSVVVQFAWFVGRCYTFVPMVMSCFCFTFYLTLRSTTFIVHNQLAGLWCWDSPYCS
jgi:hypothetical protein